MARQVYFVSSWTLRSMLRVLNAAVAVTLSLFCFVTGQTRRSEQPIRLSLAKFLVDPDSPLYGVVALYGIQPVYGPIAEYGMPYAEYNFKGTVADQENSSGIANARVYLFAEDGTEPIDSAITDENGDYSLGVERIEPNDDWRIEVRDGDGKDNGTYLDTDTSVTVPADSLKDGSGLFAGTADVELDIHMEAENGTGLADRRTATREATVAPLQIIRAGETIRVGTAGLADGSDVTGVICDASGRTVWRFSGRANTEFAFSSRGLAAGVYTAVVQCGKEKFCARMALR